MSSSPIQLFALCFLLPACVKLGFDPYDAVVDGQPIDHLGTIDHHSDGFPSDAIPPDRLVPLKDAASDFPASDSQLSDSQLSDSQLSDSQLSDSQLSDSQLPDSQLPDSKPDAAAGSWVSISTTAIAPNFKGVWCNSDSEVYAVADLGMIYLFNGKSWIERPSGTTFHLKDIWGAGPSDLFIAAFENILHGDGTTWASQHSSKLATFHGIWGESSTKVIAVGTIGKVRVYDGSKWSSADVATGHTLQSVWFSSGTYYVGGAMGRIYTSSDLNNWTTVVDQNNAGMEFYGIWGSGPDDVFAVGSSGTILHFDGQSWTAVASPTNFVLYSVWGEGPKSVFAVGGGSTILRYDGVTWHVDKMEQDSAYLSDVYGCAGNVYVVGYGGTAWKYAKP